MAGPNPRTARSAATAAGREGAHDRVGVLFMQSQDYFGADSRIHATLMKYLDRCVFDVHVACTPGQGDKTSASLEAISTIPDLHIRPTKFGPTRSERTRLQIARDAVLTGPGAIASLFGLVRYARRHGIEIVHGTEKPRDAFYGYLLARLVGARSIVHVHVKAEDWISRLTQWAMRRADALIAISEFVAESLVEMGFPRERIHTVLNGLDVSDWSLDHTDGARVREEFGLTADVPVLAIVARMFIWKGHLELVEALGKVKRDVPDVRLLIVGEDDPRIDPGRPSLSSQVRDLATRLGVEENIVFTGFRSDVPDVMAACDILALPSFEEPFGMVFLEAMALEKPVVALDNGGTREVVAHGETGLLSPPGDTDMLAANILRLIRDPELRHTMGAAGRRRALEQFNAMSMTRPVELLYRQLAGRP